MNKDEQWKAGFRIPQILWWQIAQQSPTHGLIVANQSGIHQLYAWDIPVGTLRPITNSSAGVNRGYIAPDGMTIYYFQDQHGNETGHYVAVPFEGGTSVDLTPNLPAYSTRDLSFSYDSQWLGLLAATVDGFHAYGIHGTEIKLLYHCRQGRCIEPMFSADNSVAVVASTERHERNRFSICLFDLSNGTMLRELYDPEASLIPVQFSPVRGDNRLLITTNKSGNSRPLIWNTQTGESQDIELAALSGETY